MVRAHAPKSWTLACAWSAGLLRLGQTGNNRPVAGVDLRAALNAVLVGKLVAAN